MTDYKTIRLMLLFIYSTSKKDNWRVVMLKEIEHHMSRHANHVLSWCQWSVAAGILHGHTGGFYIRPEHRSMNLSEFYEYINNEYI